MKRKTTKGVLRVRRCNARKEKRGKNREDKPVGGMEKRRTKKRERRRKRS